MIEFYLYKVYGQLGKNNIAYMSVTTVGPQFSGIDSDNVRQVELSVKAIKFERCEYVRDLPLREVLDVLSNHYTCNPEDDVIGSS